MQMSADWMAETAAALAEHRWTVDRCTSEEHGVRRTRYDVRAGSAEHLVMEVLQYPDGDERYWLQLVCWHGLRCHPFPLDSWKHRDAFVEFKFHVEPITGLGLSFFVDLSPPCPS